ncbi:class I SAM-dependent methyltransferase [uncultured Desulfuromonas sp.]|uniref:class I SAM-dependent methyltransferase n=1 Tax=uncultured Desulfuromonas sp. TaxID=181013 RepID=UPI002AAA7820|nr:class I SAM-dependent methyltransferase [uncultured Desulfuromonas sp.]
MDTNTTIEEPCPLCQSGGSVLFGEDRRRCYWRCPCCRLVFVARHDLPTSHEEKAEYDLHENTPDDDGYRRFLSRLFNPLQQRLTDHALGLDFGCGPGPTLSVMASESGLQMKLYDPFYAPDHSVLAQRYDFITATEVVEHLHRPGAELDRLWDLLQPGGILAIMTKLVIDQQAFTTWHYKNDRTHVRFFSRQTFHWLAEKWQAQLAFIDKDVIFLRKNESRNGQKEKGER